MSERTVAEDTLTPGASTTCWDPTGWAEPMYSVTTALRIAALRASSPAVSIRLSSVLGMDVSILGIEPAGVQSDGSGPFRVSTPL